MNVILLRVTAQAVLVSLKLRVHLRIEKRNREFLK
jgi:hypothetical protein